MAESGRLSFPPSATVLPIQHVEDLFVMCHPSLVTDSCDPTWHSSQAKVGVIFYTETLCFKSLSQLNNIGAFTGILSEVSAGCAGKKGICFDQPPCRRQPVPVLLWPQHGKQRVFSIVMSPVPSSTFKAHLV